MPPARAVPRDHGAGFRVFAAEVRKEDDARAQAFGESDQLRVMGVQHHRPRRTHRFGGDCLHTHHGFEIIDAVAAQVIVADVGDQRGVALRDGQPPPEDPAARRLEHGKVDVFSPQHGACGGRSGPVARVDHRPADRDLVARGAANVHARLAGDSRQEARAGRLSVGARDE